MSGIYVHIPFCKQACHYCNFHFSTNKRTKTAMLNAMKAEVNLQKNYLKDQPIHTIYFGGGTPSLLEVAEIADLLQYIQQAFYCLPEIEITLEANPDDISLSKAQGWWDLGINRLSIGIQTFHAPLLTYLNRSHDDQKALESIHIVQKAGFTNTSIDLIYAIPGQTEDMLKADLELALQSKPKHIAAYCLTIEPHTVFGRWLEQDKLHIVEEELAAHHFLYVTDMLTKNGYEQYEVSNFSLPGCYSLHNTNYWKKGHYLGIGPGAHSYNGVSRQHNVAHNHHYIQHLQAGNLSYKMELLGRADHINEYIMTSLRTKWGCSLAFMYQEYGYTFSEQQLSYIEIMVQNQLATFAERVLMLTIKGKLLADKIAADLFLDK